MFFFVLLFGCFLVSRVGGEFFYFQKEAAGGGRRGVMNTQRTVHTLYFLCFGGLVGGGRARWRDICFWLLLLLLLCFVFASVCLFVIDV